MNDPYRRGQLNYDDNSIGPSKDNINTKFNFEFEHNMSNGNTYKKLARLHTVTNSYITNSQFNTNESLGEGLKSSNGFMSNLNSYSTALNQPKKTYHKTSTFSNLNMLNSSISQRSGRFDIDHRVSTNHFNKSRYAEFTKFDEF